jgi:hypothetical protein
MSQTAATAEKTKPAKPVEAKTAPSTDIDTSNWDEANVNIDAWYAPEVTGVLIGRAIEAVRVQSTYGEQDVVKIKTAKPVTCIQGKGDEAQRVIIPVGGIVAVRLSMNLSILLELVEHQCAVEITPKGKKKLDKGKTLWTYGVKFKGQRAMLSRPKPATNEAAKGDSDADLDDLPF